MNVYLLGVEFLFQFFLLSPMVHEYGHLIMLRLLGYEGWVGSNHLWKTYTLVVGEMTPRELWLFGFGGGLFQFLVFGFMSFLNKGEGRVVNRMVAVQGLIYAFFEAYCYEMMGAFFSILAAFAYLIVWILWFTSEPESRRAPA